MSSVKSNSEISVEQTKVFFFENFPKLDFFEKSKLEKWEGDAASFLEENPNIAISAALRGREELLEDVEFAKIALSNCGDCLQEILPLHYQKPNFKPHAKELVLLAVRQNPLSLKFARNFQLDKDVVLAAVKIDGFALKYAGVFDEEIVAAAIATDPDNIFYAPMDLGGNRELTGAWNL